MMIARFVLILILMACAGSACAGVLLGTVVDSLRQTPIAGVSVRVDAQGAMTDSAGAFFLVLSPGAYKVRLTHVGFEAHEAVVQIEDGSVSVQWAMMPRVYERAPIDVVAAMGESDLHRQPAFMTVVPREVFDGKMASMADVLSATAGVQVKRLGGMGMFSTVSIRGSSSEQVMVYLDGMPLNAALGGGVDLSHLPLAQVEEVRIFRGAAAGEGGLGGAVHIRTRAAESAGKVGATGSWGSHGTRGVSAMAGGGSARTGFVAVADYASSDNNFPFLDDRGTEYNADDDAVVPRRNGDFTSGSLLGKWRYRTGGDWHFAVQENAFWKGQGMPGIGNNQSAHARLHTFRSLTEATASRANLWDRFSVRQRVFAMYLREHFEDPMGEIGVGRKDNVSRTEGFGGQANVSGALGGRHYISAEGGMRYERFNAEARLSTRPGLPQSHRFSADGGIGVDVALPGQWGVWSASASVSRLRDRLFEATVFGNAPVVPDTVAVRRLARLRTGLRLDVRSGVVVKANVGRSHRAPGFFELFGDRGGVVGNARLKPERGISWDAGVQLGEQQALEGVYFEQHYTELIQFVQVSQGTSRPFNIGKARVRGAEVIARRRGEGWALSGNYTFQLAVDLSEVAHWQGKRLPGRPMHAAHLRGDVFWGRTTLFGEYAFESGNFLDRANLRPVPARHIHNVGLRVAVYRQVRATVEAKNLRNTQIADQWGYPLPGRMFFVTVQEAF